MPKLLCCALKFVSVKPRLYEKSCIRLWPTNRFVTEAKMSFPPGVKFDGLHLLVCQTFVHGYA